MLVTRLKVAHLLVIGHSSCAACADAIGYCAKAMRPEAGEKRTSFLGGVRWIFLAPGYSHVKGINDPGLSAARALEKAGDYSSRSREFNDLPYVKSRRRLQGRLMVPRCLAEASAMGGLAQAMSARN